jgi:hypothetical protein
MPLSLKMSFNGFTWLSAKKQKLGIAKKYQGRG